jgi:hypothetical protein
MSEPRSIFAKYVPAEKQQPEPVTPPNQLDPGLTRLANWVVNHWPNQTICARDLVTNIGHIRTSEEAVALGRRLAKAGLLIPLHAHRYDRKIWMIVRNPAQLNSPPSNRPADLPPR